MTNLGILVAVSLALLANAAPTDAQPLDVSRSTDMSRISTRCGNSPYSRPLELGDAILYAICAHPQASKAWADARAQVAALRVANAARLPTVGATAGIQYETGMQRASSGSRSAPDIHVSLNLSWVLFDLGKRNAVQREAQAQLAAVNAVKDETLQTVFFNVAEAFYAVHDARASLDAARRTEAAALDSLAHAVAKHLAGAGTLADELQARTSYRRAVVERVTTEGNERASIGALATALGLVANAPIQVAAIDEEPTEESCEDAETEVDRLIEIAKQNRPKLIAARAMLDASYAHVDVVRTRYRPSVALVGSASRSAVPYQPQPPATVARRSNTIGLQLTIPIFDGFASRYSTEQAQAQAGAQEAQLHDTELQVSLDVWQSYHAMRADSLNLQNSRHLLDDAQRSMDIARGRYREGVGTFTELLSTQTALADAQMQRVLAISKWRTGRLRLAASLGKLGLQASLPLKQNMSAAFRFY